MLVDVAAKVPGYSAPTGRKEIAQGTALIAIDIS
jgi:hypothetical protein